jgi:hypothetical protein
LYAHCSHLYATDEEQDYHCLLTSDKDSHWWTSCDNQPCRNQYNRIIPAEPAEDPLLVSCSPSQESIVQNLFFHFEDEEYCTLSPIFQPLLVVSPQPVIAIAPSNLFKPPNPIVGEFFRQLLSRPPIRPITQAMSAQNLTLAPKPAVNPTPGSALMQASALAPLSPEDLVYLLAQSVQGLNATVVTLSTLISTVVGALSQQNSSSCSSVVK